MKKQIIYSLAIVLATVFVAAGIYAAAAPDVIEMNDPGFTKHTKGIVAFTHGKHVKDHAITCGECHHDDAGKPLALKEGDPVKKCSECHSAFELDKADKGMKKEEKIKKYYKEAVHANCIDCHKKQKKGPTKCADCHPKK
ncbi:MAG: cytochrome c3 family protein [Pseudomonadota bacterium]